MSNNISVTYHMLKADDIRFHVVKGREAPTDTPWLNIGDVHYCIDSEHVYQALLVEAAAGLAYCRARNKREKADEIDRTSEYGKRWKELAITKLGRDTR